MRSVTVESGDYAHAFWIRGANINEQDACRYSNSVIALNRKDSERLTELYSRKADAIVPITMKDNYHDMQEGQMQKCSVGSTKEAFFLGSYFAGNIKGLKWFCEEILPEVDVHLTIAGSGMDAFANDIKITDKITLYSFVDDLTALYESADFVLLPIISGGGMKVKTAESLKFGKYLIGTSEAFEGYDINDEIAAVCKNKQEFVQKIHEFNKPFRYNAVSRELFKRKYSFDVSLETFKNILAV
jgi:glycosyltransferase involved in cell wall biosynthesis